MRKLSYLLVTIFCLTLMTACGNKTDYDPSINVLNPDTNIINISNEIKDNTTSILISDGSVLVNGVDVQNDEVNGVYIANDIVYYESGHDFTYGEGTEQDAHTPEEAAEHTVVHITQPGEYILNGTLSKGQIAVDLGEDAKNNPEAVVTLILNNANITCEVAPAIIFYNVYECAGDTATNDVDTSTAGANVVINNGSVNNISGSYVARIYKPDSVVLNDEGTEVVDEKKLHKYDGAFYSRMSMNIDGNDGVLNIISDNEGLNSEMHLTINGGNIYITSGNDGINTNEDGVSVTTINGGIVNILVSGETGEGDGIDSNGWLIINGGTVIAQACSFSEDSGIDADNGININGGTIIATGNMLDRISENNQTFVVFTMSKNLGVGRYHLEDKDGNTVIEFDSNSDFKNLIISSEKLTSGVYRFWYNDSMLCGMLSGMQQGNMKEKPSKPNEYIDKNEIPEMPEQGEIPNENMGQKPDMDFTVNEDGTITLPDGTVITPPEHSENGEKPEPFKENDEMPQPPEGEMPNMDKMENLNRKYRDDNQGNSSDVNLVIDFEIKEGANYFSEVQIAT